MKYEEELKAIDLINLINETKKELLYDELLKEDVITHFSKRLKKIFKTPLEVTTSILEFIRKLEDRDIFLDKDLLISEYKDNEIRLVIANYLNSLNKVTFSFPVVLKRIKENYKLYNYLSLADRNNIDNIRKLMKRNPKVLLLVDARILPIEFILENMRESSYLSYIFAGFYGLDNSLYILSDRFLGNKEIDLILYRDLKDSLEQDISTYLTYSSLAKNNLSLAKSLLKKDPSYINYVGSKVLENKSILEKYLNIEIETNLEDTLEYTDLFREMGNV